MCSFLSVEDFFVAGIGFDIAGASLLAFGLFARPARIAGDLRFKGTPMLVRAGTDFVDGVFGLASLVVGFTLQAVGYVLLLGRSSSPDVGWRSAVAAVGFVALGVAIPLVAWRFAGVAMRRRYFIQLACYDNMGQKHELPELADLAAYAEILGEERRPDEAYDEQGTLRYVQRAPPEHVLRRLVPSCGTTARLVVARGWLRAVRSGTSRQPAPCSHGSSTCANVESVLRIDSRLMPSAWRSATRASTSATWSSSRRRHGRTRSPRNVLDSTSCR